MIDTIDLEKEIIDFKEFINEKMINIIIDTLISMVKRKCLKKNI